MSILINKNTRVICQGITGKVGQFHTKGCKEYGTKMVGGVTPGKSGEMVEGVPVFDTVMEAVEKTGADATMIFRAARVYRRCHSRSGRCGHQNRGGHYRRRAGFGYGEGVPDCETKQIGISWPELPGSDHAGRVQNRHHAGLHSQAGQRGRDEPQRHAHVRSRVAVDEPGPGPIDVRRLRRRSDRRARRSSICSECSKTIRTQKQF